jgi:hypothetical protein
MELKRMVETIEIPVAMLHGWINRITYCGTIMRDHNIQVHEMKPLIQILEEMMELEMPATIKGD